MLNELFSADFKPTLFKVCFHNKCTSKIFPLVLFYFICNFTWCSYAIHVTGFQFSSCLSHSVAKRVSIATTQELGVGALAGKERWSALDELQALFYLLCDSVCVILMVITADLGSIWHIF